MTRSLLFLLVYIIGLATADVHRWICYQTVCEEGIHFCNHDKHERRCSRCEDFAQRCFTQAHESNCTAYCSGRDCTTPPDIPNGFHNGSNTSFSEGTPITYSCEYGFAIKGLEHIQCREYGQWPSPPACEVITCPVEKPENGQMVTGSPDEKWKLNLPANKSVSYNHLDSQLDTKGKIHLHFGQTANFSCNESFRLFGTDSVTCTQQGYLKVPVCLPVESDCTVWISLFGGSFGTMVLITFIFCCLWKRSKSKKQRKYGPVAKQEDCETGMPSLHDKETNLDRGDSGIHTPLTAQSSALSITEANNEETIRMKIDDSPRQRPVKEQKVPVINNTNNINIEFKYNGVSETENQSAVKVVPQPGQVSTIGIEETVPSPNTTRKEMDDQTEHHLEPRPELDTNDIHQPAEDDSGEKAVYSQPGNLPSAAQQLSRQLSQHAQEQEQGTRAKVVLDSGEADMQDLGS